MSKANVSEPEIVDDLNQDDPTVTVEDESHQDSEDNSETGEEDNTTSNKSKKPSNKSNWKKMAKQNKELKARLAEYEGSDDDGEDEEEAPEVPEINEAKFTRYLLKTPEAVEHEDAIADTLKQFPTMSFEQAFTFIKANNSTSETHTDFSTKTKTVAKKLSQLTEEEALKHYEWDDAGYLAWQRKTGKTQY